MKKLKLDLQGLNAEVLTRSQLKQILGGDGSSGGGSGEGCCAHNSNWSQKQCGYADAAEAEAAASTAAQQYGGHFIIVVTAQVVQDIPGNQ